MVGVKQWPTTAIMWILVKMERQLKFDELVNDFMKEFPDSPYSKSLQSAKSGIKYAAAKYSQDPSYNHNFSKSEIFFIMVRRSLVESCLFDAVLSEFLKEFPDHDWKDFVNRKIAVEAATRRYQLTSPFCVLWPNDEVDYILKEKLKTKDWEVVLQAFQKWRQREEVTIDSLRYIHARWRFDHHKTDDPETPDSNARAHLYESLPAVVSISNKRRLENGNIVEENQNKRLRIYPSQELQANERSELCTSDVPQISANICSPNQISNSGYHDMCHLEINPKFSRLTLRAVLPEAGRERKQVTGTGQRRSTHQMYAPLLNGFVPIKSVLAKNPPDPPICRLADLNYPPPNIASQQMFYERFDQPCLIAPEKVAPTGYEAVSPSQQQAMMPWGGASCAAQTAPNWSPRDPWHQQNFQSYDHYPSSISTYTASDICSTVQQPQLQPYNDVRGIPRGVENHLTNSYIPNIPTKVNLDQLENIPSKAGIFLAPSSTLLAQEKSLPYQGINVYPRLTDVGENWNSAALATRGAAAMSCGPSSTQGNEWMQQIYPDVNTQWWPGDVHSYGNSLLPAPTMPDYLSDLYAGETEFSSINFIQPTEKNAGTEQWNDFIEQDPFPLGDQETPYDQLTIREGEDSYSELEETKIRDGSPAEPIDENNDLKAPVGATCGVLEQKTIDIPTETETTGEDPKPGKETSRQQAVNR